jgi:hypothetical protein
MNPKLSFIPPIAMILALSLGAADSRADDDRDDLRNAYTVNPLVSDLNGAAAFRDPVLQNAWGVAFTPAGSPFWVADNATGCATLYNGDGTKVALQVSIPLPGGTVPTTDCVHVNPNNPPNPTPAAPTGIIWNPTTNPQQHFSFRAATRRRRQLLSSPPKMGRFRPGPAGTTRRWQSTGLTSRRRHRVRSIRVSLLV